MTQHQPGLFTRLAQAIRPPRAGLELPEGSLKALLPRFRQALTRPDVVARLHEDVIGAGATLEGPFGTKTITYADYIASGRALSLIERAMAEVLPYYANSHTEASYCGAAMTDLRRQARAEIGRCVGAGPEHAVIFTGNGATAGINRLVAVLGVPEGLRKGQRVVVLHGPYEHHSNILPWRESGAEVHEIGEAECGGPCLQALDAALEKAKGADLLIGAFSAASNVSGITSDVEGITRKLKAAGAKVVWDYAGGGPYLPIRMSPAAGAEIDAVVVSTHKFLGGPGASGVTVVRRDAVAIDKPSWPGGGTVRFVNGAVQDYHGAVEAREEAGTPNVLGDIRAALAFIVKDAVGEERIAARNRELCARAVVGWSGKQGIEILGNNTCGRLPFFSLRLSDGKGGYLHQQLATRILSDRYGIQARGGCACAGPYAHRVLGIDDAASSDMRARLLSGDESVRPGFLRLNFSYLLSDAEAENIISAVIDLTRNAAAYAARYKPDANGMTFSPV